LDVAQAPCPQTRSTAAVGEPGGMRLLLLAISPHIQQFHDCGGPYVQ